MIYESLNFTGPGATSTLLDPEGRMTRQCYLTEQGDAHRNPTSRDGRKAAVKAVHQSTEIPRVQMTCQCGRSIGLSNWRRRIRECWRCREDRRLDATRAR